MKKFKPLQSSSNVFVGSDSVVNLNAMSDGTSAASDRATKYWDRVEEEKEESRKKGYEMAIKYNNETDLNPHLRENYDPIYYDIDGTRKPSSHSGGKGKEK